LLHNVHEKKHQVWKNSGNHFSLSDHSEDNNKMHNITLQQQQLHYSPFLHDNLADPVRVKRLAISGFLMASDWLF